MHRGIVRVPVRFLKTRGMKPNGVAVDALSSTRSRGEAGAALTSAPKQLKSDDSRLDLPGPGPSGLRRTPPMGWMSWELFRWRRTTNCETNCAAHPDSCISAALYESMGDRLAGPSPSAPLETTDGTTVHSSAQGTRDPS